MTEANGTAQAQIRKLLEAWAAAVRRHDMPAILAFHDPDIVMFDLSPPLQSKGLGDYEESWKLFFQYHKVSQAFDIEQLSIVTGGGAGGSPSASCAAAPAKIPRASSSGSRSAFAIVTANGLSSMSIIRFRQPTGEAHVRRRGERTGNRNERRARFREFLMEVPEAATGEVKATYREWIGLAVIALPCIVYAMDLTVLNLAVPSLSAELKPSAAELLWIVDIYGFLAAGSLLIMGTLGDRIGRRKLLLIGSAMFCGISRSSRPFHARQGCSSLLERSSGLLERRWRHRRFRSISNMFRDDREKTFAVSVWVASFSLGGAIGPASAA